MNIRGGRKPLQSVLVIGKGMACGNMVSESRVAQGRPWQWTGDGQEGWLCQEQNEWL